MNTTDWHWYYSYDEETWYRADSREDAIDSLDGEAGYIGEHCCHLLQLSSFINAERVIEDAFERMDEDYGDPEGNVLLGEDIDTSGLEQVLRMAIDQWQADNKVEIKSWYFARSRNVEFQKSEYEYE